MSDKLNDQMSDSMTVRKLQPTKTSTNGNTNIKRDQIVIPPFVESVYEHNLSGKLIDRRRKKTPPSTKKTSTTKISSIIRPSKNGNSVDSKDGDGSKPKLRFNVDDFRKKFNLRAVAIAELAFVKIAGKRMTVQPSELIMRISLFNESKGRFIYK